MTEIEASSDERRREFQRFIAGVRKLAQAKRAQAASAAGAARSEEEEVELCCTGTVHIAYRGLADDRLYMVYSRKWAELRYFRQNGLRVFCADCRQRLL